MHSSLYFTAELFASMISCCTEFYNLITCCVRSDWFWFCCLSFLSNRRRTNIQIPLKIITGWNLILKIEKKGKVCIILWGRNTCIKRDHYKSTKASIHLEDIRVHFSVFPCLVFQVLFVSYFQIKKAKKPNSNKKKKNPHTTPPNFSCQALQPVQSWALP